ncbi:MULTISPECIES: hypothetical protein [Microbacterium]|uniref:hypothetical protein n=1 Tax=Microbacterium TaxID=33882 RepID=UPI00217D3CAA|nr:MULTISPECIES: hypothetical protein [Microbacterium]UWF78209.1 hypothetical protein JSY13_04065 [Microbacterium neungamense]WCM56381.1 hypothetical protein JRG78_04070 [Microbacterium sp. EF45047]
MSGQTWTPAPKKGAIPLHPMTFGMLLGKAFAALRHNPKVLFGFAVTLQLGVTIAVVAVMATVMLITFSRLETVPPGSPDYPTILAGTVAINAVVGVLVALATVAFTAIVQGIVAADVSYAALGRKAGLRMLWARMRPSFWRLFGFAVLQMLAVIAVVAVVLLIILALVAGASAGGGEALIGIAVLVGIVSVLGGVVLFVWIGTKILLVPSALVLERATVRGGLVRSWRLTRGRFWVAFGVMFLIGAIMGLAAQVVSIPGSILSMVLTGVFAPTGASEPTAVIGLIMLTILPQVLVLALQAVALVVQATGATLVYLDSRMRYEGLDQALIAYTERSALGASEEQLGDPYAVDPARAVTAGPPPASPPAPSYPGPYPAPDAAPYPGQPYPGQPYGAQPYGAQPYPGQPYGAQPPAPPPPAARPIPPASDSPWAPPGGSA